MAAETHSFIDIAAIEDVRGHFAAGDALVILTIDLAQVIWCNGPGAEMLGFSGIEAAIGAASGLSRPAKRQIEGVPGYPAIGRDRPVTVRLAAGLISQTTSLRVSAVTLPGDEASIMLASPATHDDARNPGEIASHAIGGFEDAGNYLALLDENAGVLAASDGFERLGLGRSLLEALIADASRERLLKRLVRAGEKAMPVGLAQLTDAPARFLLITVDESMSDVDDAAPLASADDSQGIAIEDDTPALAASDVAVDAVAEALPTPEDSDNDEQIAQRPENPASEVSDAIEPASPPETQVPPTKGSQHDTWYFSEPAAAGGSGDGAPISIDRDSAPVRFVWRTDAEGRFSAISPEFPAVVGGAAGDLMGKSFAEVAQRLVLDPDGEIAGLLARRDTWSGRSVLWPIAGTDLRAPVDLAALPAYDRDRHFEGFRGFGVVRIADAVVDPNATGIALAAAAPEPDGDAALTAEIPPVQAPATPADPFEGEVPALEIAPKPQRRFSDKVIRLAEHRPPANEKGLTPVERNAFREIGEHLKRTSDSSEATTPVALPEQPKSEAAETVAEPASARTITATDASEWFMPPAPDAVDDPLEQPAETVAVPDPGDGDAAVAMVTGHEEDVAASADAETPDVPVAELHDDEPEAGGVTQAGEDVAEAPLDIAPRDRVSRSLLDFVAPVIAEPSEAEIVAVSPDVAPSEPEELVAYASDEASLDASMEALPEEAPAIRQDDDPVAPALAEGTERRADTSILALLPIPVLIHSGDTLHYANDAFLTLTGYETIDRLAEAGGIDALLSGPAADRGESDNSVMLKTRGGEEFPVNAFLRSVPWLGGKALLLTVVRHPAAAAQSDDPALRERMAELRTILDTATDGVVLIDNDGMVRSISRPAEALFGYDDDKIVGKPFASLFAIESQRAARDYLSGLADNGVASVLNDGREVIGREAQGRFIPLFMTIGRLPGNGGYCAVLRDITQWKRAEEELTQARAQAERVSTQKSDFLARVSHEIRTPLNAIIGFSELMLDEKFGPVANDRYRDYLRDINRSGNHVLDLVNDLLDISKIEAGQQEMDYQAVALNDALGETVAMMQPQANRERVIIRSSFASKLPEVVADLRSVRQIALNILSNAVRYTQAGGQVIVSTAHEPNGEVIMRVRDTGVGMTQAEIEQALKPFKQVNALKRARGDGTGLGLPLTKAMVEANRAKFAIYSTPGEGTLVEVSFPSTRVLAE